MYMMACLVYTQCHAQQREGISVRRRIHGDAAAPVRPRHAHFGPRARSLVGGRHTNGLSARYGQGTW